ncbi:unnamed protein product [Pylaiella littoralis]
MDLVRRNGMKKNVFVFCRVLASFFLAGSVSPSSPLLVVGAGSTPTTAAAAAAAAAPPPPPPPPTTTTTTTTVPASIIQSARGSLRAAAPASPASRMLQGSEIMGTPAPSVGLTPMPTLANPGASPDSTCSNGLSGVEAENGKTCCALYCGTCGGVGCGSRGNASDCCATEIAFYGEECGVAGASPCFNVPEEPFVVKNTFLYFIVLFIVPFVVIALVCNNLSLFRRCCGKKTCDGEGGGDQEPSTAHLHGHNVDPRPRAASSPPKTAPNAVPPPATKNKKKSKKSKKGMATSAVPETSAAAAAAAAAGASPAAVDVSAASALTPGVTPGSTAPFVDAARAV